GVIGRISCRAGTALLNTVSLLFSLAGEITLNGKMQRPTLTWQAEVQFAFAAFESLLWDGCYAT
ncbi:MAG: hypothetical protein CL681_22290, partial [Blastopirellula sp.]|nr:hypothetical protein [Blastopirellula sp.]